MDIIESYMRFRLNEGQSFRIEKSKTLSGITKVMACECVAMINEKICLIEAKSSAPTPRSKEDFDQFIQDISQKFIDTLLLYNAIKLERHGDDAVSELPDGLKALTGKEDYELFLIIHGHEEQWMVSIQNALNQQMQHILKAWSVPDRCLKAINHEMAKRQQIIEDFFPTDDLEELKNQGKTSAELERIAEEWLKARMGQ